jgi:hypothetical protein
MITCLKTASVADSLESRLMKFWTCEGLGVEKDCVDAVDAQIDKSIVFKDGKYYIDLPKREDESLAGDNFQNASNRFRSLEKRFEKHPDFERVYTAALNEKISLGVIEKVNSDDAGPVGMTYFMPHSAVIREDKVTTKVRIVFDASCQDKGVSLNDTLHKGIPRYTDLWNVLQKIRVHKWVLFSDIEKAFYQVYLKQHDKDLLRLIWRDEQSRHQVYRFTRVCFGLVPSMTLLGNVVKHHLQKYRKERPELVQHIEGSLYVDDLSLGAASEKELWDMKSNVQQIFQQGGFNLRKWVSNSAILNDKIKSTENKISGLDDSSIAETLLGQGDAQGAKIGG